MNLPAITFTHEYEKIGDADTHDECEVLLLEVLSVDLKQLSKQFLEYDTAYGFDAEAEDRREHYHLKPGKYLLLIFKGLAGLFTTLRPAWPPAKEEYYRSKIGSYFEVVISSKIRKPKDSAFQ